MLNKRGTEMKNLKIETWYDRSIKMWTSIFKDSNANQVGNAGYGISKKESIEDVKYQYEIKYNT